MDLDKPKKIYGMAAKFQPWGITTYSYLVASDFASSDKHRTPDSTKGENKHKGTLSLAASKRLRECINMFTYLLQYSKWDGTKPLKNTNYDIVLITLTLPSEQVHSDNFIKKECLGTFLEYIKYHHGCRLYVWKAETQNNGNIHFHITTDKRIPHHEVQAIWNKIIAPFGYIDAYQKKSLEKYPTGYKFNPDLKEFRKKEMKVIVVPEWEQKKRYITGSRTNWTEPHSTEIASCKKVKNLPGYLAGELAKKDKLKSTAPAHVKVAFDKVGKDAESVAILKELYPDAFKRCIQGNIWGCCKELRQPSMTLREMEDDLTDWIPFLEAETDQVRSEPYFSVYRFKDGFMLHAPPGIARRWMLHCARKLGVPDIPEAA
jgi:hypothetical protein